ncbi:MAG: adenosine deaminase, partial [Longimicrobiales bacterium]
LRDKLLSAGLRDSLVKTSAGLDRVFEAQRTTLGCATAQPDPGCDVEVRVLYQVLRALPPEMTFAMILAGFELASRDPRVVGFNLVQPEDDYTAMRDFSLHMRMIQTLRPLYPTVKVTLHAGELAPGLVPPEGLRFHIRESVRVAGASRIGHGVDIAQEEDAVPLLQEMARRNILVEIALTSNAGILGVRGKDHPLHLYMTYGVPVALSTDDEGVSRSDMNMEYKRAVEEQGVTYADLKTMARNSLRYSFADEVTKTRLLRELDAAFGSFEGVYGH